MDIKRYDRIKKSNIKPAYKVKTHIPKPSENDYRKGSIKRRFAQRTNDKGAPIYEVSSVVYRQLQTRPEYVTVSINWRLSGPLSPEYDDKGNVIDKSVSESNRIAIRLVADKIPNLKLYLPNLLQFYKK